MTRSTATNRRGILGVAVALAVALVAGAGAAIPGRALAHADYERSEPGAGAVVNEAPTRVDVWFTQEMFRREGANTLTVLGPDGSAVHLGETVLDDDGRVHLSIELAADLEPGEYEVRWTTLSALDGDDAEGSFTFTYDPDAEPSTATPAVEETAAVAGTPAATAANEAGGSSLLDEGGSFPWWAVIGALVVVLSGGLGAWALLSGDAADEGRQ